MHGAHVIYQFFHKEEESYYGARNMDVSLQWKKVLYKTYSL